MSNNYECNDWWRQMFNGHISKMYFSYWKPPGVSEWMWIVNLEASISGEYQSIGGHSGWLWEQLESLMTCTGVPYKWWEWVWEHVEAPEWTWRAPGRVAQPTRESQANCERCLGPYEYSFRGLQAWSETLQMYTSNRFPTTANMIHGLLIITTSESY
jgi:hypothetical protein